MDNFIIQTNKMAFDYLVECDVDKAEELFFKNMKQNPC